MSMLSCLRQILVSDEPVNELVAGRIAPIKGSQATAYPDITYRVMAGDNWLTAGGGVALKRARVELNLWSKEYDVLDTLKEAVKAALHGFRGVVADSDGDVIDFQEIAIEDETDLYDSETEIYQCALEADVLYQKG